MRVGQREGNSTGQGIWVRSGVPAGEPLGDSLGEELDLGPENDFKTFCYLLAVGHWGQSLTAELSAKLEPPSLSERGARRITENSGR